MKVDSLLLSTILVLLVCLGVQGADEDELIEAQTLYKGVFRGRVRRTEDGTGVFEYTGIPYAKPPVGDMRFMKAQMTESKPFRSKDTFDAFKIAPACLQYSAQPFPWYDSDPGQSEDCLYLNIWGPADKGDQLRPTKFYVHGGGWFETGSSRMGYYDGYGEAIDTKYENGTSRQDGIIVVTFNYRLGALGFLSSGTKDAPGNAGLHDIGMAFNWILSNILYFGGDYKKVTVVGQGSGAIAVSMISAASVDFAAVSSIVLNGASFLTLKALDGVNEKGDSYDNNLRLAGVLAEEVGCQTTITDNPADTVACLKGVNATDLVGAMASFSPQGPPNVFLPQIKGNHNSFVFDPYLALARYSYSARMHVLASFTSQEGSHLLTTAEPNVFGVFGENDVPLSAACAKLITRRFMKKFNQSVADSLLGDLDPKPTTDNRKNVIKAFGDVYFYCPIVFFLENQKRVNDPNKPTKFYMLQKKVCPPYNPWAGWMGSVDFDNVQIDFVHVDGKLTLNNQTYEYDDKQMEQARVTKQLITTLANLQTSKEGLPLDEFTTENPAYSVLGRDGVISDEKKSNYHGPNCDILRSYFEYKE